MLTDSKVQDHLISGSAQPEKPFENLTSYYCFFSVATFDSWLSIFLHKE